MADALGFPDATNTGVPAGTALTPYNGNLVINTSGAVIEGLDIHGTVFIEANNVTLKNCKITSGNYWVVNVQQGTTGTIIQDCDIDGAGSASAGIQGSGAFFRNDISRAENGIVVNANNTVIQDNYVHDLQGNDATAHYDGIAAQGGLSNITIRHNTVTIRTDATAAVYINNDFGAMSGVVVDNNKLSGGMYTVYSDEKASKSGQITGVEFTNNYLNKGYYGYAAISNNSVVWQGNVDLGTGMTVSQGGTLSPNSQVVITTFSTDSGIVGDGITNDSTLTLTGSAPANGAVTVYDGATLLGQTTANGSGAWSYTTGALANGSHSLTATATSGGTTSSPSSPLSVTVDTVAPNAPTIASFSTDTGTMGDGITSDNTLTLTGSAAANSTVKVYDGATQIGTTTANSSGAWSYTTSTLSNATHSFTATAMDAAGNTGAASAALSVTVDAVAPSVPTTITSFSTDSNVVGDGITNDDILTLTGTAAANSTVKVFDGATQIGTATADASGNWSYTTGTLANGSHSFTAAASPASAPLIVAVDTVAPGAPTIASFSTDTGTVGDGITSDNTLTLTGSAAANSTMKVYDGATLLGTTTANGSGAWSYTTGPLSNATHNFTATAMDVAGNTGAASAALAVTVDTGLPSASIGFPDATNTGVPPGVILTPYNGNLVIDTPGAVIEGLDIHGNVTITADNVTLKNCKVTSSEFWVVSTNGVTGAVIQDCEIIGLGATDNSRGIGGQGTFLRNNISGVENGINVEGSNTLIQDNYIHDLKAIGDPHYDGIQMSGGFSNITVRHNTVSAPSTATAAVYITNDFGAINGVVVDDNKLSGGMFTVYSDEKSSNPGQITGVQYTNNDLQKGYYGYLFLANNSVVWQGNIDLATGMTVSQNGTLSPNSTAPDLTATNLTLDGAIVSYQINNTGTGAAAASTTGIYLSTDSTITTADILLTTVSTPLLATGTFDTESVSVSALSLPSNLVPGTYYIGVLADHNGQITESSETNNRSTAVPHILGNNNTNTLIGTTGNNVMLGLDGNDALDGGSGSDTLAGGSGHDHLTGGTGADVLEGGIGFDYARYDTASTGVVVDLMNPAANTGDAAGDSYISIQGLVGSNLNDTLLGDNNVNDLHGFSGNDFIYGRGGSDYIGGEAGHDHLNGGAGADILNGGGGFDYARYDTASTGVVVDLMNPGTNTGDAAGDTYISIEGLVGSNLNDTLFGDNNVNDLHGFSGVDVVNGRGGNDYIGGEAGNDTLNGGAGIDTLVGGADNDTLVFYLGEAQGDIVVDFSGNGAAAGDQFQFVGYGTAAQGATFTQVDATHWSINSADGVVHDIITLSNGASIDPNDYLFV